MTKRTWNPKQKKRARKHGFLHRAKRHLGVLKSRRAKGRKRLTANAK